MRLSGELTVGAVLRPLLERRAALAAAASKNAASLAARLARAAWRAATSLAAALTGEDNRFRSSGEPRFTDVAGYPNYYYLSAQD